MTIHDILHEIRLKANTEREKGGDFERLMKLWFLTDPRYSNLEKVWLWEEFPCRKDFGGKDLGIFVLVPVNGKFTAVISYIQFDFLSLFDFTVVDYRDLPD